MTVNNFSATATIALTDPMRLIRRLCKHWAHKLTTEYSDHSGSVDFGDQTIAKLYANENATLTIEITAPTATDLEKIESVVARHIERMIPTEEISEIKWVQSI